MKNPGCANNRGSPLHASGNLSYQITLLSNAPAAMIFKPKPPPAMMMSHAPKPASVQISTFLGECLQSLPGSDLTGTASFSGCVIADCFSIGISFRDLRRCKASAILKLFKTLKFLRPRVEDSSRIRDVRKIIEESWTVDSRSSVLVGTNRPRARSQPPWSHLRSHPLVLFGDEDAYTSIGE